MKLINTRKKFVALAVTSALSGVAGISAPAYAMNVAQDGLGEALIFPYYTVRSGWDTLMSVVNTSDRTVLFKVRWREAKNSREVRDFNVALSPHDVWTAVVTADGTQGALVRTFDKSCTSPKLLDGPNGSTQVPFTSAAYDGSLALSGGRPNPDSGGAELSRTQEGYMEIIEMAISSVPESLITATAPPIESATQHVDGSPRNCVTFDSAFLDAANLINGTTGSGVFSTFVAPQNVLKGFTTLINVATGKSAEAEAVHIQSFQDSQTIIFNPGDELPDLSNGEVGATANMFVDGALLQPVFLSSVDTISGLLMTKEVLNEYATGAVATSAATTDWIVTFPTKHFYTDGLQAPPFNEEFSSSGSCDPIGLSIYNREEKTQVTVNQTQFSPRPQGPAGASLCNEVNVLTFNQSGVLGSSVQLSVDTATVGTEGWAALGLNVQPPSSTSPELTLDSLNGFTFFGLPTIGVSIISRDNTEDAGNNRNYAISEQHARRVVVTGN